MAVLMISSDLPEVLAMSDRILVMREGKLMQEFSKAEATPQNVIAAATGQIEKSAGESRAVSARSSIARRSAFGKLLSIREVPTILALLIICLIARSIDPTFLSDKNLKTTLLWVSLPAWHSGHCSAHSTAY
jgi:ABC-type multidrug transport system ATPase subunit